MQSLWLSNPERTVSTFILDEFLPYRISVLAARISREFAEIYRQKFGISRAEWRVVAHLSRIGAVSVREIHKHVDMDKSKVSRASSRLEENGYITKKTNELDKRLVELSLTGKGRGMVSELAPLAMAYEKELLEQLGGQAPGFRDAVTKLLETYDAP
jgi:DNA-binding MarR family transcriptional regulator